MWCHKELLGIIRRKYSSNVKKLVGVVVDKPSNIATVTLQSPPVNAMNVELLTELSSILSDLEKNKCRGIILTSSVPNSFSAGVHLNELYRPSAERLKLFWTTFQDIWLQLQGSSAPTVAYINGHALATGCFFALCCEYRVMLRGQKLGINEAKYGMVPTEWVVKTMVDVIGIRQCELALTSAKMFTTEEAIKIGMIDEIAEDKADAISKSMAFLKRSENISLTARGMTKRSVRSDTIKLLADNREADLQTFYEEIMDEETQQGMEIFQKAIEKKNK